MSGVSGVSGVSGARGSAVQSIPGVIDVEILRGAKAPRDAPPTLLVEVPHGADTRADYDAVRARMQGELPADLHCFFHINTDVGAWQYGRRTAELILEAEPRRAVLLLRSRIPRTLVDCNRPAEHAGGDLHQGGLTAGVPAYITHDGDRAFLLDIHRQYVDVVRAAFAEVCGNHGGLALVPHTYGPRTLGIQSVGADIVEQLRWACAPEREPTWPLRADVDLLTRDGDKQEWSPTGMEAALLRAFTDAGFAPKANDTYYLHPSSLGYMWATMYRGQVLCLEVRRDHLVERWMPFEEMRTVPEKVERVARVLAPVMAAALKVAD